MPAETIDDVLRELDGIIEWSFDRRSRLGYFAALYRRVTLAVKEGILNGRFQDGVRMERLDIMFASRYLDALQQFRSGRSTTLSWRAAFQAASYWYPLVLQQLLLGMNAHINLDLGVAAACCAPGSQFSSLQADFNQINTLLAEQVGAV
ncbi:MAG: DUF5995 family protein, partial [Candidatus Angelobacter sp.]